MGRPAAATLSPGKKIAFTIVYVILLAGLVEAVFAIREPLRERRRPRLPVMSDPYRGSVLKPGGRADYGDRLMEINGIGLRGGEVGPKRSGTTRILTVGGSTTFGLYASDNQHTWPAVLEASLRERGFDVEVLNAGTPGWTLRTSVTHLELLGFGLEPDVVISLHAYNDLGLNHLEQYRADSLVDDVEALRREQPREWWEWSAALRFAHSRLRKPYSEPSEKVDRFEPEGRVAFERNLRRLVRRSREHGARVLLSTFPTAFRPTFEESLAAGVPEVELWYRAMSPLAYPHLMTGLREYNEAIRSVGAELGVAVVDTARLYPSGHEYYATPIHHTDLGEVQVARIIEEALLAHGLVAGERPPPARIPDPRSDPGP